MTKRYIQVKSWAGVKHARIKGTDFELKNARLITRSGGYGHDGSEEVRFDSNGVTNYIPVEWVEFYDPRREEPPTESVELDKYGYAWQKLGRDFWYRPFAAKSTSGSPNGSPGSGLVWDVLQDIYGPTRPMKTVE